MKFIFDNVQGIKHAEIEVEGFTTVVGKSSIGKTSMLRGIEGGLVNAEGGDSLLRDGETSYRIEAIDDDFHIIRNKGKSGSKLNDYTINGDYKDKVGVNAPEEIRALGFWDIELQSGKSKQQGPANKLSVQFASQAGGDIFLINESSAVLAEVFSKLSKLEVWLKAVKNCEKDLKSANQDIAANTKNVERLGLKIAKFEGLDELSEKLDKLTEIEKKLRSRQEKVEWARSISRSRAQALAVLAISESVATIQVPKVSTTGVVLLDTAGRLLRSKKDCERFRDVVVPDIQLKVTPLSASFRRAIQLLDSRKGVQVPEVDFPILPELTYDLSGFLSAVGSLSSRSETLEFLERLEKAQNKVASDTNSKVAELKALEIEIGQCPLCDRSFQ